MTTINGLQTFGICLWISVHSIPLSFVNIAYPYHIYGFWQRFKITFSARATIWQSLATSVLLVSDPTNVAWLLISLLMLTIWTRGALNLTYKNFQRIIAIKYSCGEKFDRQCTCHDKLSPGPIGLRINCYTNWDFFLLTAKCRRSFNSVWAKFDSSVVKRDDYVWLIKINFQCCWLQSIQRMNEMHSLLAMT